MIRLNDGFGRGDGGLCLIIMLMLCKELRVIYCSHTKYYDGIVYGIVIWHAQHILSSVIISSRMQIILPSNFGKSEENEITDLYNLILSLSLFSFLLLVFPLAFCFVLFCVFFFHRFLFLSYFSDVFFFLLFSFLRLLLFSLRLMQQIFMIFGMLI